MKKAVKKGQPLFSPEEEFKGEIPQVIPEIVGSIRQMGMPVLTQSVQIPTQSETATKPMKPKSTGPEPHPSVLSKVRVPSRTLQR